MQRHSSMRTSFYHWVQINAALVSLKCASRAANYSLHFVRQQSKQGFEVAVHPFLPRALNLHAAGGTNWKCRACGQSYRLPYWETAVSLRCNCNSLNGGKCRRVQNSAAFTSYLHLMAHGEIRLCSLLRLATKNAAVQTGTARFLTRLQGVDCPMLYIYCSFSEGRSHGAFTKGFPLEPRMECFKERTASRHVLQKLLTSIMHAVRLC